MKIAYHINQPKTVYAARFIYEGYKNAFTELGHDFYTYTADDNLEKFLAEKEPDILVSSLNRYMLKYLNLDVVEKYRKKGMVFFNQIKPWAEQTNQYEGSGLKSDEYLKKLIKSGKAGDVFFHWFEQDDPSMDGFEKETGYKFETVLLAADTNVYYPDHAEEFECDLAFVGSYLPSKREFIKTNFKPLQKKYNVKVYGSDWNYFDRYSGYAQKIGQYFNIPYLKTFRDIKLSRDDERRIYTSSTISLNIHENHQRQYGSDFNERTFKIIAAGGFEICDNVKVIRKYLNDKELVIGEDTKDWFEKIDYYIKNPDKREAIIKAGRDKVLKEHTYKNRAQQFIDLYNKFKNTKDN